MSEDSIAKVNPVAGSNTFFISTFYFFQPVLSLETTKTEVLQIAETLSLRGLVIIGPEGLNSTVCAPSQATLEAFKSWIIEHFEWKTPLFKDSASPFPVFKKFQVKIRDEIVTLGRPDLSPLQGSNRHLSPEEWNKVLKSDEDFALIDTRNWYETNIGTFKGALNPNTSKFTDFKNFFNDQKFEKDKKILIFCTGGIRCEKGILELQEQGYNNVHQLEGGILNYLQQYPNDEYEGECFVFDHRVAVDQNLRPSEKYKLCPHCGQPGQTEINCKKCDSPAVICASCATQVWKGETCTKHCAHQLELHPGKKGKQQVIPYKQEISRFLKNASP